MNYDTIRNISQTLYPNTYNGTIQYGTAGFRTHSKYLAHVSFRMGILAVLRSREKNAAVGVMITASHNEEPDNGIKLIDPAGEMLESSWESIATEVANAADSDLVQILQKIIKDRGINEKNKATVLLGRDTRESSPHLSGAATKGIEAAGTVPQNYGIVTTPQLHYLVVSTNTEGDDKANLDEYYRRFGAAFERARASGKDNGNYIGEVIIDAANGVGAIAANEFAKRVNKTLKMNIYNDGNNALNRDCGADYVKIRQAPPLNVPVTPNARCVSIDGDADRIVYYYVDATKKFHLLDGDRIATLVAEYLKELIQASGLDIQLGLVQTAYANGASTAYMTEVLKLAVACVPTGVKHLHHRALEFEIGVYFEANGHGTVMFKNSAVEKIRQASIDPKISESRREAATKLVNLVDVINQVVGDALSDMLLVETILYSKGWNLETWEQCYNDFPNRQLKVRVKDRNVISTADAERKCITPKGLQDKIDELTARYAKGRSFVRPSGTEDVVRVYAECENPAEVDKLASEVALAVYQLAAGVGPAPVVIGS